MGKPALTKLALCALLSTLVFSATTVADPPSDSPEKQHADGSDPRPEGTPSPLESSFDLEKRADDLAAMLDDLKDKTKRTPEAMRKLRDVLDHLETLDQLDRAVEAEQERIERARAPGDPRPPSPRFSPASRERLASLRHEAEQMLPSRTRAFFDEAAAAYSREAPALDQRGEPARIESQARKNNEQFLANGHVPGVLVADGKEYSLSYKQSDWRAGATGDASQVYYRAADGSIAILRNDGDGYLVRPLAGPAFGKVVYPTDRIADGTSLASDRLFQPGVGEGRLLSPDETAKYHVPSGPHVETAAFASHAVAAIGEAASAVKSGLGYLSARAGAALDSLEAKASAVAKDLFASRPLPPATPPNVPGLSPEKQAKELALDTTIAETLRERLDSSRGNPAALRETLADTEKLALRQPAVARELLEDASTRAADAAAAADIRATGDRVATIASRASAGAPQVPQTVPKVELTTRSGRTGPYVALVTVPDGPLAGSYLFDGGGRAGSFTVGKLGDQQLADFQAGKPVRLDASNARYTLAYSGNVSPAKDTSLADVTFQPAVAPPPSTSLLGMGGLSTQFVTDGSARGTGLTFLPPAGGSAQVLVDGKRFDLFNQVESPSDSRYYLASRETGEKYVFQRTGLKTTFERVPRTASTPAGYRLP